MERYRRRDAAKRGSGETLLTLNSAIDSGQSKPLELTVYLDDALTIWRRWIRARPRSSPQFFGGLDGEEIAAALSISPRTVKREWAMAKLWLHRALAALEPGFRARGQVQ